jgi:molecular chaperone GrpE
MSTERAENQARPEPESEAPEPAAAGPEQAAANDAEPGPAGAQAEAPAEPGLEEQVAELKDRLLRAVAEAENTRRRAQRDVEEARRYAVAGMARDLLGVADNLRRALESVPDSAREGEFGNLLAGVELTERELLRAFEKAGISRIEPLGQKLDPHFHQAMMQVPDGTAEPGTIVQVVQVGYKIHDRLLRPAMVGVATAPQADTPGQQVDTQA